MEARFSSELEDREPPTEKSVAVTSHKTDARTGQSGIKFVKLDGCRRSLENTDVYMCIRLGFWSAAYSAAFAVTAREIQSTMSSPDYSRESGGIRRTPKWPY